MLKEIEAFVDKPSNYLPPVSHVALEEKVRSFIQSFKDDKEYSRFSGPKSNYDINPLLEHIIAIPDSASIIEYIEPYFNQCLKKLRLEHSKLEHQRGSVASISLFQRIAETQMSLSNLSITKEIFKKYDIVLDELCQIFSGHRLWMRKREACQGIQIAFDKKRIEEFRTYLVESKYILPVSSLYFKPIFTKGKVILPLCWKKSPAQLAALMESLRDKSVLQDPQIEKDHVPWRYVTRLFVDEDGAYFKSLKSANKSKKPEFLKMIDKILREK